MVINLWLLLLLYNLRIILMKIQLLALFFVLLLSAQAEELSIEDLILTTGNCTDDLCALCKTDVDVCDQCEPDYYEFEEFCVTCDNAIRDCT